MRDARQGREGFDIIVMDPPRAGSTPEFLEGAARLVPERIVYISCNPTTQRRDIELLLSHGYILERLTVVDMFPHTSHAETVGILKRR